MKWFAVNASKFQLGFSKMGQRLNHGSVVDGQNFGARKTTKTFSIKVQNEEYAARNSSKQIQRARLFTASATPNKTTF
jgi:hypothetical protein